MKVRDEHLMAALTTALMLTVGASALSYAAGTEKGASATGSKAIKAEVKEDFKKLDKDQSGSLSEQEFTDMGLSAQDFRHADADGNSRVTLTEYTGHIKSQSTGTSRSGDTGAAPMGNAEGSAPAQPQPGAY